MIVIGLIGSDWIGLGVLDLVGWLVGWLFGIWLVAAGQ